MHVGEGMVNFMNAAGDQVAWHLSACKGGTYTLGFTYALAAGSRTLGLDVNGVPPTHDPTITFPA
eukprot:SAG31_NODE_487_length_14980_cov_9.526376_18_plen_65_part_00